MGAHVEVELTGVDNDRIYDRAGAHVAHAVAVLSLGGKQPAVVALLHDNECHLRWKKGRTAESGFQQRDTLDASLASSILARLSSAHRTAHCDSS